MLFLSYIIFTWGKINEVGENIVGYVVFHHPWLIFSWWRRAIFFWGRRAIFFWWRRARFCWWMRAICCWWRRAICCWWRRVIICWWRRAIFCWWRRAIFLPGAQISHRRMFIFLMGGREK